MAFARVYSRANLGIQAPLVTIEVHLSNGLPSLSVVGVPEASVRESKDRVRSAILNSDFDFPARRITVNLAPADLPKQGGQFDLAIALGILVASNQISCKALSSYEFLGELSLSGELRSTSGSLPAAIACGRTGRQLICCADNVAEASLCVEARVMGSRSLLETCGYLLGQSSLFSVDSPQQHKSRVDHLDLADVKGQIQAKRALEIAACGGHHLLLFGPPGTGKSMLASRLPGLLPPLRREEALEVASIQSVSSRQALSGYPERPFAAPHHSASAAAMVGGGSQPKPGEISLAHNGVLFLDELPEFQRSVLEVLREPLENGFIRISRANAQLEYPSRFQLVAAMNPCPCGYHGYQVDRCRCTPDQINRYRAKISGPLLDRIDLHIPVHSLKAGQLHSDAVGESSAAVSERVIMARERQYRRQGNVNASLFGKGIKENCGINETQQGFLDHAMLKLGLSARALHRVLKVARTIADMAGEEGVEDKHLHEALSYRLLDRQS